MKEEQVYRTLYETIKGYDIFIEPDEMKSGMV